MSGPIVRSGPSEKFTDNWSQAFAGAKAAKSGEAEGKAKKGAKASAPAKKKAAAKPKKKTAKK